jgi:subtilisin family serine protease
MTSLRVLRDDADVRTHDVRTFHWVNAFAADLTAEEVAVLKKSPDVRYISPVVERHASSDGAWVPAANSSVYASSQSMPYGLQMIQATELWPLTRGRGPIHVAVFDTGVDMKHPDLAANIAGGYNTFTKNNDPVDDHGHGTHVTGIIAAVDNSIGVVGVAPEVRIWPVKVLDKVGFGADENVVAGIDWVISKKHEIGGDWIVSLSLGATQSSPVEEETFKRVIAEGIVAVAAAGNRSFPDVEFPAAYPGVIAVGAVDSNRTLATFSDHGPHLTVVAPGVRVLSTTLVASVPAAGVTLDSGAMISAAAIAGSSQGEIVGPYVFCGLGRDGEFPPDVARKIALIKRGEITFNQKVRNAQAAGALAVVIFNHDNSPFTAWTLLRPDCETIAGCDDPKHAWPIALAVGAADGARLLEGTNRTIDVGSWMDDYKLLSGTSMATPHVSATAALIWSLSPDATADRVREAIVATASDLGTPGFDLTYGYGLVNALAAAQKLAPWQFGLTPPPASGRRRPAHP